ncbi:MAG TPA: recombination protein O N-terminal domain-containing protein [Candidatus Paceibacterota bacterium]|nr:recombination protein O N-terminal domain-containing protein [Candidatus Paceibacterota bacterium]
MRHKYETSGIVLARSPFGEANVFVTLLTSELGLVRARTQGVRKSGAKLAAALATFAESRLVLVRGEEGWRIAGAVLEENWFKRMERAPARETAIRVSGFLLRLVGREGRDPELFPIIRGFFEALATLPEDADEPAEMLAALRVLAALGLDAGDIPGGVSAFSNPALVEARTARADYIARINRGIAASGL